MHGCYCLHNFACKFELQSRHLEKQRPQITINNTGHKSHRKL